MPSNRYTIVPLCAPLALALMASWSSAAIESRNTLKTYFETGDVPTQEQFSVPSLTGDVSSSSPLDFTFARGGAGTPSTFHLMTGNGDVLRPSFVLDLSGLPGGLGVGSIIGPGGSFLSSAPIPLAAGQRGFMGFSFSLEDGAGIMRAHYGFIDLSMDAPLPGQSSNALTIYGWAWESTPDAPIATFSIPTPGAAAMVGLASCFAARRRRQH